MFGKKRKTDAEKLVTSLLYDDTVHVISSFELNQVATLTYGEVVCDEIFQCLQHAMVRYLENSPLTLHKSLAIAKHILIYGAEKAVSSVVALRVVLDELMKYNTVIIEANRRGVGGMLQRIKGGGVDKGGPVRELAKQILMLLNDVNRLREIRNKNADSDSLVPVGSNKVAYLSDGIRLFLLKKKMQQQRQGVEIKSNLAKPSGGFGGGYNAGNGQTVVGAAHGLEEMMKMAQKHDEKYSDSSMSKGKNKVPDLIVESNRDYNQEYITDYNNIGPTSGNTNNNDAGADLLDFGATAPTPATAMDFMNPTATTQQDLLGLTGGGGDVFSQPTADLLDFGGTTSVEPTNKETNQQDIFGMMSSSASKLKTTPSIFDMNAAPNDDPFVMSQTNPIMSTTVDSGGNGLSIFDTMAPPSTMSDPPKSTSSTNIGLSSGLGDLVDSFASTTINNPPTSTTADSSTLLGQVDCGMNSLGTSSSKKTIMASNEDRFAALNALEPATMGLGAQTSSSAAAEAEKRLLGFGGNSSNSRIGTTTKRKDTETKKIVQEVPSTENAPAAVTSESQSQLSGISDAVQPEPMGGGSFSTYGGIYGNDQVSPPSMEPPSMPPPPPSMPPPSVPPELSTENDVSVAPGDVQLKPMDGNSFSAHDDQLSPPSMEPPGVPSPSIEPPTMPTMPPPSIPPSMDPTLGNGGGAEVDDDDYGFETMGGMTGNTFQLYGAPAAPPPPPPP